MSRIYISSILRIDNVANAHANTPKVANAMKRAKIAVLQAWLISEKPARKNATPKSLHGLTREEYNVLVEKKENSKIPVIKMVRERLMKDGKPFGLKEAKDLVENAMMKLFGFTSFPYPQQPPAQPNYGSNYDDNYGRRDW